MVSENPPVAALSDAEVEAVDRQFDEALAHHQAGRIAEATALYRQVLQVDTEHPGALYLLGGMAYGNGDFQTAFDLTGRALREQPDDPDASHLLGLSAIQLGRFGAAVDAIERALALRPVYPEAQGNLAIALRGLGTEFSSAQRHADAARCLQRLLELDPADFEVLGHLGTQYAHLADFPAAIDYYQRSLQLQPAQAGLLADLAAAQQQLGQIEPAIGNYRRALELAPDRYDILSSLGTVLAGQHQFDEAERCFRRALELKPDYAVAHSNLGGVLMSVGREQEAILEFERCLQIQPDKADIRHLLASLRGQTTETAPPDYVQTLFDKYAETFEEQLVGNLDYHTPTLMRAAIDRTGARRFCHALDLGCGTGLGGEQVRDIVDELRGVDLSPKMLQQAERKDVYDHLYVEDVVAFAERSAREFPRYDLVLSADVFIYVGNLAPLFRAVQQAALPGALFVFSVEDLSHGTFQLLPSGRYAHSAEYIRTLAVDNGFTLTLVERCDLRKERGAIIPGNIFVLTC
jgi:predicted TPR repeat methyltransferase